MTHPPAQAPPAPKGRLSRTLRPLGIETHRQHAADARGSDWGGREAPDIPSARTVSTLLTLEAAIGVAMVEKPCLATRMQDTINVE